MKFLFSDVAFYLYKAALRTCIECCCYVRAGYSSYYLDIWSKLQKWICRTIGPSIAATLETLAYCQSVVRLSFFYRSYLGITWTGWAGSVSLFLWEVLYRYSNKMHDFSVNIPRSYKSVYVSSVFSHTVRLWNSLPAKHFPLIYDLNGFKSNVNWHIFGFFSNNFLKSFSFFSSSFPCNFIRRSGCSAFSRINPSKKMKNHENKGKV